MGIRSFDYCRLLGEIRRIFPTANLVALTPAEADAIRQQHPGIPEHYLEFLQNVGWGDLSSLMIYSGPVPADEICGADTAEELSGVLLLGDNFAGWMLGLDSRDGWRLVGIEHCGESEPEEANTLAEYLAGRLMEWESY